MERIKKLITSLDKSKVLVIGDVMLDKFIAGKVERISPEAPVQVVEVYNEEFLLGGAANTCRNVSALGGDAFLIGIIGEDEDGDIFSSLLDESNIRHTLLRSKSRRTTKKVRIISNGQQLIRVDYEENDDINEKDTQEVLKIIKEEAKDFDYIIVSDYAKGVVTQDILNEIKRLNKYIIVDPKPRNSISYEGAFLITPNLKEARTLVKDDGIEEDWAKLSERISNQTKGNVLLTLSGNGMQLKTKDNNLHFESLGNEVYDVTGAGDTVIATIAACLSIGATLEEAAKISCYTSGIVVRKRGTAVTNIGEILEFIDEVKLRELYDNKEQRSLKKGN